MAAAQTTNKERHRTLNGDIVEFGVSGADLSLEPTGKIEFRSPGGALVGFQAGVAGIAHRHLVLGDYPDFAFSEEYTYSNGILRVGRFVDIGPPETPDQPYKAPRHVLAEWSGHWHSVFAFTREAEGLAVDVISQYQGVHLDDDEQGVSVSPRNGTGFEVSYIEVTKEIPRLGVVTVEPLFTAVPSLLPSWSGLNVPGGELFIHGAEPPSDDATLILAGESMIAVIAPPVETVSIDTRLTLVETLTVIWIEYARRSR